MMLRQMKTKGGRETKKIQTASWKTRCAPLNYVPSWLIPCLQFGFSSPLFCQIRLSIIELPLDRNVFAHPLVALSSYRQDLNVEIRSPKSRPLTSLIGPLSNILTPARVRSTVSASYILARQQCTQHSLAQQHPRTAAVYAAPYRSDAILTAKQEPKHQRCFWEKGWDKWGRWDGWDRRDRWDRWDRRDRYYMDIDDDDDDDEEQA